MIIKLSIDDKVILEKEYIVISDSNISPRMEIERSMLIDFLKRLLDVKGIKKE